MKRYMKPSYLVALALAFGALGWVFTGDLSQAKRHYGLADDAKPQSEGSSPGNKSKTAASPAAGGSTGSSASDKALPTVRVRHMVAEDRVREIILTGHTDVVRDADVTAETTGRVVELIAKKGQWLEEGETILRLALEDRQSKLRQAEARVEFERIGFEAAKKLSRKGFQSEVKLAQEKSELETAKADLAAIRLDIARTTIKAPISGYVDTLPLGVGDYLKSGDTVVSMINPDPMRVVVNVSERDVIHLKPGDTAVARTVRARAFEGEIRYIARRAEETTRTFRIDVWVGNPDRELRDGQTMEVILRAGQEKAHRVSPAVLTLSDAGVIGIKYVDQTSRVRFQPVRIIAHTPDGIWLGGLPETVDMITVGQEFVVDGQLVRPVSESAIVAKTNGKS